MTPAKLITFSSSVADSRYLLKVLQGLWAGSLKKQAETSKVQPVFNKVPISVSTSKVL